MKKIIRYATLPLIILLIAGCGEGGLLSSEPSTNNITIGGAGVKGPLAHAIARIYLLDLNQDDLKGPLLDEGRTGRNAAIAGLDIEKGLVGLLLLEIIVNDRTVDLNSGKTPVYSQLVTVVDVSRIYEGDLIYATPFTTMAVELAKNKADTGSPFSGNNDGGISEPEYIAALDIAQNQVKSTLGFGLDTSVDVFNDPPLITEDTDTTEEQTRVVRYRQAIEALAALTDQIAEESSKEDTAQQILDGLTQDLGDGKINGQNNGQPIDSLDQLDEPIDEIIEDVDPDELVIPGTDTPVNEVEYLLVEEMVQTGARTDTTALENGEIETDPEEPNTVVDSDGDGVNDDEDAFPTDPSRSRSFTQTAWVGAGETTLNFSGKVNGAKLFRTTDQDCDIDNYLACEEGQMDVLHAKDTIIDTALNTERTAYYTYKHGDKAVTLPLTIDPMPTKHRPKVALFKDKLWFLTGLWSVDGIWSSKDGINWSNQTSDNVPPVTSSAEYVVFKNKMWMVAGQNSGGSASNRIWSTEDGTYWVEETPAAEFPERYGHKALVFEDKIWVMGGWHSQTQTDLNDVWFSSDGLSYTQATAGAPFPADSWFGLAVLNNRMWVVGDHQEVWSSANGADWRLETGSAPWAARHSMTLTAYDGKLWFIAGYGGAEKNDVWSSTDGVNWTEVTGDAIWGPRYGHVNLVFKDRLWLFSGSEKSHGYREAWSTSNGASWKFETTGGAFPGRAFAGLIEFQEKLWLIGGFHANDKRNDIWSSTDGETWTQEKEQAEFPERANHLVLVHDDKLWLIGGINNTNNYLSDVWSSPDGVTWTRMTEDAGWGNRYSYSAVSGQGRLWVIGGRDRDTREYKNDVWSSEDGGTWDREADAAGFSARFGHMTTFHDDRFWLVSGRSQEGYEADVWTSENGVDWSLAGDDLAYPTGTLESFFVWNDQFWLINTGHSVWSSSDGLEWNKISDGSFHDGLYADGVLFKDKLFLVGGYPALNYVWSSADGENWYKLHRTEVEL